MLRLRSKAHLQVPVPATRQGFPFATRSYASTLVYICRKTVTVAGETEVTFILNEQKLLMKEVVIQVVGDPAYEIIRQAIKKRPFL